MPARLTQSEVIARANIKHNNKYSYSKFKYIHSQIKSTITCPIHGDFEQRPNDHLKGQGCPKCKPMNRNSRNKNENSIKDNRESFVSKAKIRHNDKYNYINFEYINYITKGIIICPIHGEFSQSPANHLSGRQCPKCGRAHNGASKKAFMKRCKDNKAIFYILKCYTPDKSELFYKVGITSTDVRTRYKNKQAMPYIYEIVQESIGTPEQIMEIEYSIKESLREYHYLPQINFAGSETECFTNY